MEPLFYTNPKATHRSAAGSVSVCVAGGPAFMLVGEDSIRRHRGGTAADENDSALVARCVL